MITKNIIWFFPFVFLLQACGGGSGSGESEPETVSTPSPTITAATYDGREITLDWQVERASSESSFNIYYAEEPIEDADNYAAFDGGQLIQNVTPPHTVTVPSLRPVYHFQISQVAGGAESSPSDEVTVIPRYDVVNGGSQVIDRVNDILWNRCMHGQSWNSETATCAGSQDLLTLDRAKSVASAEGMEVPNTRELLSLTYCSSGEPSYFPRDIYLTGNEYGGLNNPNYSKCTGDHDSPAVVDSIFPEVHPTLVQLSNYPCSDGYSGQDLVTFSNGSVRACGSGVGAFVRLSDRF